MCGGQLVNDINLFLIVPEARKSKIKAPAGSESGESPILGYLSLYLLNDRMGESSLSCSL